MKAYLERIKQTFLSGNNMSFSVGSTILAAICCYIMLLASMGGHPFGDGLRPVITILTTGLIIAALPTIVSTIFETLQFFAEFTAKDDPRKLLEDAQLRLEAEKILIEAERLAQERRELIDKHLQEQIHGADKIVTMLDQPRNGKEVNRQRVALS